MRIYFKKTYLQNTGFNVGILTGNNGINNLNNDNNNNDKNDNNKNKNINNT